MLMSSVAFSLATANFALATLSSICGLGVVDLRQQVAVGDLPAFFAWPPT